MLDSSLHPELLARLRRLQMIFATQGIQVPQYGQPSMPPFKPSEELGYWITGDQEEAELFDDVIAGTYV